MRLTRVRPWASALSVVAVSSLLAVATGRAGDAPSPEDRAVAIRTTGCGLGHDRAASGVVIGDDLVLTAAHVVAQSAAISVGGRGVSRPGTVVVWDRRRDLALLAVEGLELGPVEWGRLERDDTATMVGGLTSGMRQARVVEWVNLTIEEALGTDRYPRLGYQLDVEAAEGDSGAGVYDDDGRLAGMIFGVAPDGTVAWATAAAEIESLLAEPRSRYECDPALSFLRESAGL